MSRGILGFRAENMTGERPKFRQYARNYAPGSHTWTCPRTGTYRFVLWGPGGKGAVGTQYGGGSGAHVQKVRRMVEGETVALVVSPAASPSVATTATFRDGLVLSAGAGGAGSGAGGTGGTASGGDINLNGSTGGTGGAGGAGAGDNGGAGGTSGGGSQGGGAGAPGWGNFQGGNGANTSTQLGGQSPGGGGWGITGQSTGGLGGDGALIIVGEGA